MKVLQAKTLRSGIALGKAFKIAAKPEVQKALNKDAAAEAKRLAAAVAQLKNDMTKEAKASDKFAKDILEAQMDMLEDSAYQDALKKAVAEDKFTAEYAAVACGDKLASKFEALDNEYLRTRAEDVRQVAARLAAILLGVKTEMKLKEPVILFAEEFTPAQLAALDKSMVLGIVAHKGSPTSHTAILATNYDLPYLTDVNLNEVKNGVAVVLDGENGCLILEPDEASKAWAKKKVEEEKALLANAPMDTKMKVYANISTLEDLEKALAQKADGIGLFRTEFLFMNRAAAPDEAEQLAVYRTAVEKMEGKEVIIRTIDAGTDKPVAYLQMPKEENPALGLRGVRVSLKETEMFRVQLRALLQAACYGNLGVMFPMITSNREIEAIKEQVKLAAKELEKAGKKYKLPKLGIMIETPAAALISDELAPNVDFFSIGTNDLTQYTLALDRQAEGLEEYYEPHHEAIFRLIAATVKGAHAHGAVVGLCGELGSNEKALARLVEIGLDEVSVGAAVIPKCRAIIAKAEEAAPEVEEKAVEAAEAEEIVAPADGKLIAMENIPDETFAQGILGPCFAVEPLNGNICAPISGTVINVAETKHAVIIRAANGTEVLVHIGIDTVKLGGKPFEVMVKEQQQVAKGDLLVKADLDAIKAGGCSIITPVILCNLAN